MTQAVTQTVGTPLTLVTGGDYNIPGGATDYHPSYCLVGESNGPLDVAWEVFGTQLVWYANALHPASYEAYQNETLVGSGSWDGSDIHVDVNATSRGYFECTIIAFHVSGHNTTRMTNITVKDLLAPNWVFVPPDIIVLAGDVSMYQSMTSLDLHNT